jgi:serine/threonine-protein kinase
VAIVVLLVVTVAAVGWWLGSGRWTHVPSLVGKQQETAIGLLQEANLDPKCCTQVFSETVPAGVVIKATPAKGDAIRGTDVALVVSKGPERFVVDTAFVGQPKDAVVAALAKLPITLNVQDTFDSKVPVGSVSAFDPPAGTQLKRGQAVTVLVSKGHEPVAVPDVRGQSPDAATTNLKELGFKVARGPDGRSADVPVGAVMAVSPAPTASAAYGSTVTITVCAGVPQVAVPDVVGKSSADATKALTDAGLKVKTQKFFGDKVLRQTPAAGETVDQGTEVTILLTFG